MGTSFPTHTFCTDVALYRTMLAHFGITEFDDYTDEDLEFDMPLIVGFTFTGSNGFYNGWESDMPNADAVHRPFGFDHYRYFFLADNPDDPSDPFIRVIDHERPDEVPTKYRDLTAARLLAILRPE